MPTISYRGQRRWAPRGLQTRWPGLQNREEVRFPLPPPHILIPQLRGFGKEAIEMNDPFEPIILVFCCRWCSYAAADLAGSMRIQYPPNVRIIMIPCTGRHHFEKRTEDRRH